MNSLPKTVIRQRRGCDMNPVPSAPESSTLTTWLATTEPSCCECVTRPIPRIWQWFEFITHPVKCICNGRVSVCSVSSGLT